MQLAVSCMLEAGLPEMQPLRLVSTKPLVSSSMLRQHFGSQKKRETKSQDREKEVAAWERTEK